MYCVGNKNTRSAKMAFCYKIWAYLAITLVNLAREPQVSIKLAPESNGVDDQPSGFYDSGRQGRPLVH
jgi:hypothetical protein